MRFRLLATIMAVLASAHTARAQAMFPPETDDAALRYWFALAEVQEPSDDDATRHLFGEMVAGRVAWDETKLGPILDSNRDALRTMQRATKLPACNWGFDYRNGAAIPVWFGDRARLLSHLNELQGIREMAHGDSRTAVDTWLAGVHFGQDMSRSGPVIAALIAHAIILDNLHPLRDSAQQGKLNEEQKTELSVVVKTMPEDGFDWGAAWGVEFAIGDQFLQKSRTYASKVHMKRADASEVGVMRACGHDVHMAVFVGTARLLAQTKDQWSGTLILIGQPAEEAIGGASALLRAGLYTKFPKPQYVLALHDTNAVPTGKVAWHGGMMLAGADSVDITVRGYGGHGAAPQAGKDPIVIASEIVVALQTVMSREMDPQIPTVVTVGTFHAGTKNNIIPGEAKLQLTVRTMNPQYREKVLASIARITNGIAAAAGVPAERAPIIEVSPDHVPATINDSELTRRVAASLERTLGKENVLPGEPIMASEDFSLYALEDPKPSISMFWLGAVDPQKLQDAKEKGTRLPGPHSSEFAPVPEPTIRTGVKAMSGAVLDLMKK